MIVNYDYEIFKIGFDLLDDKRSILVFYIQND